MIIVQYTGITITSSIKNLLYILKYLILKWHNESKYTRNIIIVIFFLFMKVWDSWNECQVYDKWTFGSEIDTCNLSHVRDKFLWMSVLLYSQFTSFIYL